MLSPILVFKEKLAQMSQKFHTVTQFIGRSVHVTAAQVTSDRSQR